MIICKVYFSGFKSFKAIFIKELYDSKRENELAIPNKLEREKDVTYTFRATKGTIEFFDEVETITYGYNGSFLRANVTIEKDKKIKIKLENDLGEETIFHRHGLEVAGEHV